MQDSLRPHFDLDVSYEPVGDFIGLFLTIRNVGAGPGTVRLFTGRTDVHTDSCTRPLKIWDVGRPHTEEFHRGQQPLLNSVLASIDSKVFYLGRNTTEFPIIEGTFVSSLSIYYEDVFGRYFRTRIVYEINADKVQLIAKESFVELTLPINPMVGQSIDDFRVPECSIFPVPSKFYTPIYLINYLEEKKRREIPATEFTNGVSIRLRNVTFDRLGNGFPKFELQVGKRKLFTLYRIERAVRFLNL